MAKKAKTSKEKAEARKAKQQEVQNNYRLINDIDGIKTEVLHVREQGCLVRESSKAGIATTWIPNVKPKKKGVNVVLVQDTPEQREEKRLKRQEAKAKKGKAKK